MVIMANNAINKIIDTFVLIEAPPLKWLTIYPLIIHLIDIFYYVAKLEKRLQRLLHYIVAPLLQHRSELIICADPADTAPCEHWLVL